MDIEEELKKANLIEVADVDFDAAKFDTPQGTVLIISREVANGRN